MYWPLKHNRIPKKSLKFQVDFRLEFFIFIQQMFSVAKAKRQLQMFFYRKHSGRCFMRVNGVAAAVVLCA